MSDFDKEAEREKLREKLADDREKRQHTQQLSELLLKGATMTNRHCDRCGDPIFRHEGQEFCPSCDTGSQDAAAADRPADDGDSARPETTGDESATAATRSANGARPEGESVDVEPASERAETAAAPTSGSPETAENSTPTEPMPSEPTPTESTGGDLDGARASLARTVATFAERARTTEDPRRAREHLEAAREAAEALAALR
ncbi:Sjogren's syndrome/scleroderma autoantigen 1 family protein [Haloparvum alkalitolerans]|uniref:Sjogren's syndrome/scleroderma autoantigen 1 family protein n=1 Tax=Haloparvum alkalitolerans TaxID=1042953 RepID=UPI003CEDEB1E